MLRRFVLAVGFAASIALSAGAAMGQDKSAESLAVEASTLYQAATGMADPRERGRLYYIVRLRIEEIKKSFPQSVIAAQLSFGRYQTIDVTVVTREAQAGRPSYPAEAAALQGGATARGGRRAAGPELRLGRGDDRRPAALTGGGRALARRSWSRRRNHDAAARPAEAARPDGDRPQAARSRRHHPRPRHGRLRHGLLHLARAPDDQHARRGGARSCRRGEQDDRREIRHRPLPRHDQRAGRDGWKSIGIDTAILKTDGWTNGAHLPFAESVEEGEAITIGGYPGRASEHQDKAYDTFFSLIGNNRLPTPEAIPNLKFDFGYVQSVFVKADTGIENLQNGVNTSGGNSGSPIVNRCGSIVAQHYQATNAVLDVLTVEQNGQQKQIAIGDTSKFNYAVSGKEVMTFLRSAHIPFSIVGGECPSAATD